MLKSQSGKTLAKKLRNGFKGYPLATIALYGPTNKTATKLVVGIILREGADAEQMKKWHADDDVMKKPGVAEEVLQFIKENNAMSVAMTERIIGCPHESGVDYPEGQSCPHCPFWAGHNRWTGEMEHLNQNTRIKFASWYTVVVTLAIRTAGAYYNMDTLTLQSFNHHQCR